LFGYKRFLPQIFAGFLWGFCIGFLAGFCLQKIFGGAGFLALYRYFIGHLVSFYRYARAKHGYNAIKGTL